MLVELPLGNRVRAQLRSHATSLALRPVPTKPGALVCALLEITHIEHIDTESPRNRAREKPASDIIRHAARPVAQVHQVITVSGAAEHDRCQNTRNKRRVDWLVMQFHRIDVVRDVVLDYACGRHFGIRVLC